MTRRLTLLTVTILIAGTLPAAGHLGNVSVNPSVLTAPPTIYMAEAPNQCLMIDPSATMYYIYVHAPDYPDISGVIFDLSLSGTVIPEADILPVNVTQYAADTSTLPYHIVATWTPQALEHTPILAVTFPSTQQLEYGQLPENVSFLVDGGNPIEGEGALSWGGGCCIDCLNCGFQFFSEDHVLVAPGATTTIPFKWTWFCHSPGGSELEVTDTQAWVTSWSPEQAVSLETCVLCVRTRYDGDITVTLPADAPAGATSTVTIRSVSTFHTRTFVVEADPSVSTEESTWGQIKALYR